MEVIHPRCAGLDISKKDAKVCVRIAGAGAARPVETVTTGGRRPARSWRCGIIWPPSRSPAW